MVKAKEILGETICIRGNVPLSIMATGTPDQIRDYCKKLIDTVGQGRRVYHGHLHRPGRRPAGKRQGPFRIYSGIRGVLELQTRNSKHDPTGRTKQAWVVALPLIKLSHSGRIRSS